MMTLGEGPSGAANNGRSLASEQIPTKLQPVPHMLQDDAFFNAMEESPVAFE